MSRFLSLSGLFLSGLLTLFVGTGSAWAQDRTLDKLTKAMPDKASAEPKQPRKLLIFTKTTGYRHGSIAIGTKAITMMGDKTGAYTAVHTEDESYFAPEKLNVFDAVLMLNTTGEPFRGKNEELYKKSLVDFVAGGKGLVGFHAACDTYDKWSDYSKMMGGRFAGHPWGDVPVKNLDPKNPVSAVFDGKDFNFRDEIYTFKKDSALPEERRILLCVDNSKFDEGKLRQGPKRDDDNMQPLAWIANFGKGRNFYCAFGHGDEIYQNPTILKFYLAGIQFALGDLKADASPTKTSTGTDSDKSKTKPADKTPPATIPPAKKTDGDKSTTKPGSDKTPATKADGDKSTTKPADKTPAKADGDKTAVKPSDDKTVVHAAGKAMKDKLVIRIRCGVEKDYTDLSGVIWSGDQHYSKEKKFGYNGGKTATRETASMPGSDAPDIYLSERYAMDNYRFDVPDGKYTVRVHMCETWEGSAKPGQRAFGVKIQGKQLLKDFDLVKESGFMKPYVLEAKDVEVTNGKLMVEFVEKAHQHPLVNAIEVLGQ